MWVIVATILSLSQLGFAKTGYDISKYTSYVSKMYSNATAKNDSGVNAGTNTTVLEVLFGSETPPFNNDGLSWPPLPRFWGQEGYSKYLEAKFSIGTGGLPIPVISAEKAFTFRYEVTTTFHYLGSLKFLNRESDSALNSLLPEEIEKIFIKDWSIKKEFFNVKENNPIVGMCQYELALYYGNTAKGGATYLLSAIVEGGRVDFSRLAVFSRIFNLKPRGPNDEYSSKWYLENECDGRFKKFLKPYVDEQFAFKALEYNALFHPHNTCELETPKENINDKTCQDWHDSFWSTNKKKRTVARCETQTSGESHCVLKSKLGQRCSMYYTDGLDTFEFNKKYIFEGKTPPERPVSDQDMGPYSLATLGSGEYPCDAGLKCSMDEPLKATCKKVK